MVVQEEMEDLGTPKEGPKLVLNDQKGPRLLDCKLLKVDREEMAEDVGLEHWIDCGRCA